MRCSRCGKWIRSSEAYNYGGESLCEDCYMDILSPPRVCDPWAVHSAQTHLKHRHGPVELTELQQRIIDFVRAKGRATAEEIATALEISQPQLIREFASLRHMEFLRGVRENGRVYFTLFPESKAGR
ncbi:MAG: hypothetical protein JRJ26_10065 [Deltaproteobacteria bacterium]|nr:hypothetical protein [Deltaproteobacteria bacterium]